MSCMSEDIIRSEGKVDHLEKYYMDKESGNSRVKDPSIGLQLSMPMNDDWDPTGVTRVRKFWLSRFQHRH